MHGAAKRRQVGLALPRSGNDRKPFSLRPGPGSRPHAIAGAPQRRAIDEITFYSVSGGAPWRIAVISAVGSQSWHSVCAHLRRLDERVALLRRLEAWSEWYELVRGWMTTRSAPLTAQSRDLILATRRPLGHGVVS